MVYILQKQLENLDKLLCPKEWKENYPEAEFNVIHQNNYLGFVL